MRKRDLLYYLALITLFFYVVLAIFVMFGMSIRAKFDEEVHNIMDYDQDRIEVYDAAQVVETERQKLMIVAYQPTETPTVEPVEDWYIESIPLEKQLQKVVFDAACSNGVDYFTALGLIQVESEFDTDAVNPVSGCYGLCQLNPNYFQSNLTADENIEAGMEYLGELIEQYNGDIQAALTAYNAGVDTGRREYARAVLGAADAIIDDAGVVTN